MHLTRPENAVLISLLMGGVAIAQPTNTPPNHSAPESSSQAAEQPRQRFKVTLTVTSTEDLKVSQGATVVAGQILADRVRDRTRLQFQRDSLVRELGRLRKLQELPLPEVQGLPSANYDEEGAAIEQARHRLEDAQRNLEQQKRKLDVLKTMPQADLPEAVIPHEEIVAQQREREYNQAAAEVDLMRGRLEQAREQRSIEEYEHSLELSKRAIAIRQQELTQQGQVADLEARLSEVEISLSQLSAVRSPYSGTVQRVQFKGQSDQNLSVELVLLVPRDQLPGASPSSTNQPVTSTPDCSE